MNNTNENRTELVRNVFRSAQTLNLPVTTAATAATYLHHSLKDEKDFSDAAESVVLSSALLFLAGKSTENIRRIRDVLNAVRHHHKFDIKALNVSEYSKLKEQIIEEEHRILRLLGFATHVELPHAYLLNYARYLDVSKAAVKFAWAFLNDCFVDRRVIEVPPCVLACASLLIGLKVSSSTRHALFDNLDATRFPTTKGDDYTRRIPFDETSVTAVADGWWRKFHITDDSLWPVVDWIAEIPLTSDSSTGSSS